MLRLIRLQTLCALGALLLVAGCGQQIYRADTTVAADGRVTRAIYQPADETPADAFNRDLWTGVTYAPEIPDEKWTGPIRDLPPAAADKDRPYFAAWGQFASPDKLPQTYLKRAPQGLPDGKLEVRFDRNDFIFVVEASWTETLTDVVTLEGMHRSRSQFLAIAIPLVDRCLQEALGPQYEVDHLTEWFRTTGSSWFVELTDAFFEAGLRGELPPNNGWKQSIADVCARYDLDLRDKNGRLLDDEQARKRMAEFAAGLLHNRLKRRDGRDVSQQTIDDLLELVNLKDPPAKTNPRLPRLDSVATRVITEEYGSQQNFEDLVAPLAGRMLGLYRSEILGPPRRFHYALEMPGSIVKTNGVLTSGNRVEWDFEAVQAYPYGYAMECRALVPQVERMREVLGRAPLADRDDMLTFVSAVQSDFTVAATLRNCLKQQSPEPLYTARDQIASENGDTRPYDTVLRVLKLPPKAAAP